MSEEQLAADRQEAASIRYGVWLRIAILTSGYWAVYHGKEPGGGRETGVIDIVEALDMDYLRVLSINEQAKAEEHHQAFRSRLDKAAQPKLEQKSTANLEDMGL